MRRCVVREPRPKQRFPEGGKELYELLRMDHEPVMIWVLAADEAHTRTLLQPDTLLLERAFDPMVYFWPVDGQHVVCDFDDKPEPTQAKRLVKALLRDGATWVTLMWRENNELDWDHYGDPDTFMQRRYAVDAVALPRGRGGAD
jgi:hypothetical protein